MDGRFVARQLPQQPQQEAGPKLQRPSWLPDTAPLVPPISQHQLDALAELLQGARNVVVLTGAGCSTESAIPDYRGPTGAYSTGFKPITHQQVGAPHMKANCPHSFMVQTWGITHLMGLKLSP